MQEQHLDELAKRAAIIIENPFSPEAMAAKEFDPQELEKKIAAETTNLPADARTPTASELSEMNKFKEEYYDRHPKASSRQMRRALQRKFNINLLPNTKH